MNQLYSKLSYQHDYLLILRGLLALTVVLHHWGYGAYFTQKTGIDLFKYLAPDGGTSVAGFFMISGYLMSKILNTKYNCKNGTWHYFYNRILRIFPIYYFASLFAIIVAGPFGSYSDLLPNLRPWVLLAPIAFPNNAPLWSICTEMQFYTLAPLIYYLFPKKRKSLRFYLLIYLSVLAINLAIRGLYMHLYPSQFTLYTSLEVNMLYFLTGWIAYLARNQLPKYPTNLCILLIFIEIFILWGWDVHYRQVNIYGAFNNPIWYYVIPMVLSISFFILLPSLDRPIPLMKVRVARWLFNILIFLGITSYSAYAIHAPFPQIISCIEESLIVFSIKLPHLFYLYLFSYVLYIFVEKPFMRIKF